MFTSANLAAARLSALENHQCLKLANSEAQAHEEDIDSFHGCTLGKNRQAKRPLGSSLVSVAALISKLDEEQPTHWESRSAPTLQLRPIRKPDEALRIFLKKVEAARVNREDLEFDTTLCSELDNNYDAQTVTLDRVPAFEREIRRTAYSLLMKRCGPARDFITASDNRFNASTSILTARAEAVLLAERLLRRLEHGFSVNTTAWTLTTPDTEYTPALFEACRTPQSVKVTVKDCHTPRKEDQMLQNQAQAREEIQIDWQEKPSRKSEMGVIPRIITGILDAAERMPRLNVADVPVNAMSAATTIQ